MALKIAINGFGRIGRLALRSIAEKYSDKIEVIAINDLTPIETQAHLFEFDSAHGRFQGNVQVSDSTLDVGFGPIRVLQEPNPENLPWKDLGVDLVYECSGRFTKRADAAKHLTAGAKHVLISAPSPDADATVVYGVNHKDLQKDHAIVSNASCTTNCLAPVAKALEEAIGIEKGYMTTIHAYTADQRLVDSAHSDLRRARAAAQSMIPTSTGAARAVGLVLPDLKGKLDGTAIRVPTQNVSLVDLTFIAKRPTSVEEIHQAIDRVARGEMKGVLGTTNKPLVSIDFNHDPHSSTFDKTQTQVLEGNLCRIVAWYDNEWGFSNRMNDVALHLATLF